MEPGLYPTLSNKDYHGDHGSYSKSSLADFAVYPFNIIYQRQHRARKTTFDLGSSSHTAILEPDKWESDVAVCPNNLLATNGAKSTAAYKEWAVSQPKGKAILTEAERDRVLRIRDSVHENPAHSEAKELLTGGLPEVSVFWEEQFSGDEIDEETGYHRMISSQYWQPDDDTHKILFKARPDYLPTNGIVADLKTTAMPIDRESAERHAYNLKYHWSAGLTTRGLSTVTGRPHREYYFVVVEVNPPHEVAVFRAAEEFIAAGKVEALDVMGRLAWCDKTDKWPGAPNVVQQLGLPFWVHRKITNGGYQNGK